MNVRSFVRIMVAVAIAVMSIAGIGGVAVAAPAGSIAGYVRTDNDTAIAGAWVIAWDWDDVTFEGIAYTSADGSYSLTGLRSDIYRVRAYATGYFSEYYDGVSRTAEATQVVVTDPNATSAIDFNLSLGSSIAGHVYQDDGITAIPNAQVDVYENITNSGSWKWLAATVAMVDGSYSVTAFAGPGHYLVKAQSKGWAEEYYDNVTTQGAATPIEITAGNDATGIDFTLTQIGYTSGTVYQADGVTPIGGATITARDNATQSWVGYTRSVSGTGFYYINLDPGTYRILATAPGYMPQVWDNVTVVSGEFTDPENWGNAAPISVVGTDETPDKNFSLLTVKAVSTNAATSVTTTLASLNGNLTSKGGDALDAADDEEPALDKKDRDEF